MSMRSTSSWILFFSFVTLLIIPAISFSHEDEQPTTFIIHVVKSEKPPVFSSHEDWYTATLHSLPLSISSSSDNGRPSREIIYTYNHAIHGFAARLTPYEASHLESRPGIVSVIPERTHQFYTTHTPQFLGLSGDHFGLWHNSGYGDDVIIGVLDSGIWPERQSFNDSGLGPVPKRWKGTCETGPDFPETSCNRKIIGARAFYKGIEARIGHMIDANGTESRSPRDTFGHGTHCASTAAGSAVKNAGFRKYAVGEARGIATKARIASYKIGWSTAGIVDSDIVAGMDKAVEDGVDVMSLSFGVQDDTLQYYQNVIAIGAFAAMEKGILVSNAPGNSGPAPNTAVNLAPWMLSVGASTIDREFPADVILGDGQVLPGASLYSGDATPDDTYMQVVYAAGDHPQSRYCVEGSLDSTAVAGKIVICDVGGISGEDKGTFIKNVGGAGMILIGNGEELIAEPYPVPAAIVSRTSGDKIIEYLNKHSHGQNPSATIKFRGTAIGSSSSPAPKVAFFSSRGPNRITPEILKPDVIAPGVEILAANTGYGADPTTSEEFALMSGTSMACPHVSGLAALLRKTYPKWSPAAIRSALMTTAYNVDNSGKYITDLGTGNISTPFQHGSGHVDPNRALNPGLVYDIVPSDYEAFLCSIGYDAKQISVFVKDRKVDCKSIGLSNPGNLNYPSFSVVFKSGSDMVKYKRVVKNVGSSVNAVYKLKIRSRTPFVKISVSPTKLVFSEDKTSLSYEITFESRLTDVDMTKEAFGSIEWYDGVHAVKSPIAFRWGVTSTSLISSV
ncbi:subtilisin-like protease SBT1.4 [Papaver somniferum]|uniref:subtilisin-like protease SBT1.4 n=1 Tax=Papaver somniferum TaxID=3469 RepID=UPI000E7035B0|nr:subtilisin-like protease SBT1.4 [Papaver somniferum]